MCGDFGLSSVAAFIRRHWRTIAGACLAGAGLYIAMEISDKQGRADLSYGYAVRMTCEDDPESHLWSGGCDRIAADIARTDRPSFGDLYQAFVIVHHSPIPSAATARQFANVACEPDFNLDETLKGKRYILVTEKFTDVCSLAHAQAIMDQIDTRARALMTIERGNLTYSALAAGTLANLTNPLAIVAATLFVLVLWIV
ncbi:MAG: hypothetical protein ACR2OF_00660 [Hyphomicrobium sp.]